MTRDSASRPNLNTGTPWSEMALINLRTSHATMAVKELADFIRRTEDEVRDKLTELGLSGKEA